MTNTTPEQYDYCLFHMPNGKFPREAAKRLGFTKEQLMPSLLVDRIGNSYTATTLVSLAALLDIATPGQRIFMVSYGSGAGSDGFVWETTERLTALQKKRREDKNTVEDQIAKSIPIDYIQFLKQTHKL
jgi:hydroxymethylglutaryl-CoA synthase